MRSRLTAGVAGDCPTDDQPRQERDSTVTGVQSSVVRTTPPAHLHVENTMTMRLLIEEESGSSTGRRHPHNGYYAGDFSARTEEAVVLPPAMAPSERAA